MTYPSNVNPYEVERLLHHMPAVVAKAENDFTRGFAASVTRQARRKGWWPSQKQLPVRHRQVVGDLRNDSRGARSQAALSSRVMSSQIQWASALAWR
jgi:hypothetical protein